MKLVGKFVHIGGLEYWHSGEILEEHDDGSILVRIDSRKGIPPRSFVFGTDEYYSSLLESGEMTCSWAFFLSREELMEFIKWCDTPDEENPGPKIVQLPVKK